jgi:toxin ParE1/3/4
MAKLRVSVQARRDIRRIGDEGVRAFGLAASEAHLDGIRRLFSLLESHPFAGQELSEPGLGVRTLSHRPHRIFYQIVRGDVVIVRVLHQSRDVRRAWREPQ